MLWAILKIVLLVLLILFLLLLVLLLLVLFLPVGYTIEMRKEPDPEDLEGTGEGAGENREQAGGKAALADAVQPPAKDEAGRDPAYYIRIRAGWLFDAVCFKGAFEEKAGLSYQARALWKILKERKGA